MFGAVASERERERERERVEGWREEETPLKEVKDHSLSFGPSPFCTGTGTSSDLSSRSYRERETHTPTSPTITASKHKMSAGHSHLT